MQRPLTLEEVTGAIRAFKAQMESSSQRPQQHKVCFPLHNKTRTCIAALNFGCLVKTEFMTSVLAQQNLAALNFGCLVKTEFM